MIESDVWDQGYTTIPWYVNAATHLDMCTETLRAGANPPWSSCQPLLRRLRTVRGSRCKAGVKVGKGAGGVAHRCMCPAPPGERHPICRIDLQQLRRTCTVTCLYGSE